MEPPLETRRLTIPSRWTRHRHEHRINRVSPCTSGGNSRWRPHPPWHMPRRKFIAEARATGSILVPTSSYDRYEIGCWRRSALNAARVERKRERERERERETRGGSARNMKNRRGSRCTGSRDDRVPGFQAQILMNRPRSSTREKYRRVTSCVSTFHSSRRI